MRIKQAILDKINKSNTIKARLIEANDVHPGTVQRWIAENDERLTTAKNLEIICEVIATHRDEILEDEKSAA